MTLEEFNPKQEKGETWIQTTRERAIAVVKRLKEERARLITITGVDDQTDMKVYYHFDLAGSIINLVIPLPKENPGVQSIVPVYPSADLYERELAEMFNMRIEGHPDLKPLFLSKDLQGKAPLLKSFKGVKDII